MEIIIIFGIALFLILLSSIFYLIFHSGTALVVMALVITSAIGLAVMMVLGSIIFPNAIIDNNIPDISMQETVITGEAMQSNYIADATLQKIVVSPEIINIQLCADDNIPCSTTFTSPDISIYWEVQGGVGCCNTFNCNYDLFHEFCGAPFNDKLYDIYLDGEKFDWGEADPDNYDYNYTCSYDTPWNYFWYNDLNVGPHIIKIVQTDCMIVVDTKTITFNLIKSGEEYIITDKVIK